MCNESKNGLNLIKFDGIGYHGSGSPNGKEPYDYMSKLLTQNIIYAIYHEAKTTSEIARELDVPAAFVEDEMKVLIENDFVEKVAGGKYLTNVYIQYNKKDIEEFIHRIVNEYAEIVYAEYVPTLVKTATEMFKQQDVYSPENDLNYFMWSILTYACRMNTRYHEDVTKYYVKRKDGSEYVPCVWLEPEYKRDELSFNPMLYYVNGDMTGAVYTENHEEPLRNSYWQLDTYYDSRNGIEFPCKDIKYLYENMKGKITKTLEQADNYKRLYDKGYLVQSGDTEYVNMVVMNTTEAEFWEKLPKVSDDLYKRMDEVTEKVYQFSKSHYPKHIQELYRTICGSKVVGKSLRTQILEKLYSNGTLKPLTENQKKTVNMILFCDVLPK
jgi:hypothetical protein